MKQLFKSMLVIVIVIFSGVVKANVYQQLASGELTQIKIAAQTMAAGRENTKENTDILAEILLSKYEDALLTEIDTLSWACKALASTGDGRYRSLLVKIYNSKPHKKLRKYAKSSFKKLPKSEIGYEKGSIDLSSLKAQEVSRSSKIKATIPKANLTQKERMLFLIAKGDLRSVKAIAQEIYANGEVDNDIADALSELLLSHYTTAAEYQVDTLAWICRSFGEIDNGRYTQLMEIVAEKTNATKIKTYARSAYRDLPKAENSYVKGTVDLQAIVERYKAQ